MKFWNVSMNDLGVVLARFVNPPMNYFCAGAVEELSELVAQWRNGDVRVVVLTGGPEQFITHYSVEELAAFSSDRDEMQRVGTALSVGYHDLLRSLRNLPKPVIAAISGDCMGGGLELALWCDLRVAQLGNYRIGLPEIHMGIMPGGSGTQMISRMLGTATAIQLTMLGELLSPEQALIQGLVHYTADDSANFALTLAKRLCSKSSSAIAEIKAAIYGGSELSLAEGLGAEAQSFLNVMCTREALSGMKHYLSVPEHERRQWLER
jgi:enoyl-CoA hydratase